MGAVKEKVRRDYPVRLDISKAPVSALPARTAAPTIADRVGDWARSNFPSLNAARVAVGNDANNAAAAGDYGRAAGAVARGMVTYPAGLAADVINRPVIAAAKGVGNFLGGLVGSDGSTTVNKAYTPPAATTPAAAVQSAMAAGHAADETPLTPQELLLAHLDTVLRGPLTQRGMTAAAGALPAPDKHIPVKDNVLTTTAQVSQSVYDSQIKDIVARRDKGELDQKSAQAMTDKATQAYFLRNTALVGNPLSFAQANMLPQPDDEEQ